MTGEPRLKRLKLTNQVDCKVITRSSHLRNVFNSLPDELWLKILCYLNTVEVSKMGAVCSKLYVLTRDHSLWEKLQFDIKRVNVNVRALEKVMDKIGNIKEIRFTNVENKDFDSMTLVSLAVRARKTLKVLVLSREIKLENVAIARLGCLAKLEVLEFALDRITPTGLSDISKLKSLKEIRNVLSFDKIRFLSWSDESWQREFNNLFKELKNLVVLDFSGIPISRETFRTLALNNPSLETVILRFSLLYEEIYLVDLTQNCPNLKHLDLSFGCGINEDNIDALVYSKKLVRLNLAGCEDLTGLTESMVKNIAKNCPRLKYLDFWDLEEITDGVIRALAQYCPNLEHLDIEDCENVSEGAIEELLMSCKKLRKIIRIVTPTFKKKMRKKYPDLMFL